VAITIDKLCVGACVQPQSDYRHTAAAVRVVRRFGTNGTRLQGATAPATFNDPTPRISVFRQLPNTHTPADQRGRSRKQQHTESKAQTSAKADPSESKIINK